MPRPKTNASRTAKSPAKPLARARGDFKVLSEVQQTRDALVGGDDLESAAMDAPAIPDQPLQSRPFSAGSQVKNELPDDDRTMERTVEEGVADAEDDEISTASKSETKSEG